MNIAELSIHKKVIVLFITFLIIGGGIMAYESMGRLEDPEFTIKVAKVVTFYPGASADEVQREVTDVLETAIQQMPQLWRITSRSTDGLSIITPEIRQSYSAAQMPQIWDELRRKVGDAQSQLPPGVPGIDRQRRFRRCVRRLSRDNGEGHSYAALKDYADFLRRELLQVPGVANVALNGVQSEQIYVEISRAQIAQLGIPLDLVYRTIGEQNAVVDAGRVGVGGNRIAIRPSGEFDSVEAISDVLIPDVTGQGRLIRVRDIARVFRDYQDPPNALMRYNGRAAIGLGISTVSGGNVVVMGDLVAARLAELAPMRPLGMDLDYIFFQGEVVTEAIDNFIVSLAQAVAIVVVVLLVFMGLRSGLIIGVVLLVTILATLIVMAAMGITLQRISLGALIIALGMLVDNAIVITDGILVRISRGMDRIEAAREITRQTTMPLLGATFIAVLAFVPIGFSPDNTGEYTRSLFLVMLISLLLSWITALTLTPLLCHLYLKPEKVSAGGENAFYRGYRKFLVALHPLSLPDAGGDRGPAGAGDHRIRDAARRVLSALDPAAVHGRLLAAPGSGHPQHLRGHARDRALSAVARGRDRGLEFRRIECAAIPAHLFAGRSEPQLRPDDRRGRRSPPDRCAHERSLPVHSRQLPARAAGGQSVRARPRRGVQGPGAIRRPRFRGVARSGGPGSQDHAGLGTGADRDHRLAPAGAGGCSAVLRGASPAHGHRPGAALAYAQSRQRGNAGRHLSRGGRPDTDRLARTGG